MTCAACGGTIADSSVFCPLCGAMQAAPAAAAQNTPMQQQTPAQTLPVQPPAPTRAAPAPAMPMPPAAPYAPPPAMPAPPYPMPSTAPYAPPAPAYPMPSTAPYAPAAAVPAPRIKTRADLVSGIVFIVLGLCAMGLYAFISYLFLSGILPRWDMVFAPYGFVDFFTDPGARIGLLACIMALALVLGTVSALTLLCGGILSLINGRGRKPAYASVTLSILSLLCFLTIFLLRLDSFFGADANPTDLRNFVLMITPALLVLVVGSVLLAVKRKAKRKAMRQLQNSAPQIAATAVVPPKS